MLQFPTSKTISTVDSENSRSSSQPCPMTYWSFLELFFYTNINGYISNIMVSFKPWYFHICMLIYIVLNTETKISALSGVARAFSGGRFANPEGQNEEENEQSMRKNKKNWPRFEEKWGKWNSCPPRTVRLAMALSALV